jgi:uncharacterized protein YgiM (DUF1202 family)
MKKFLFTFVILSILLSPLNSSDEAFAWPNQYGIIKGTEVNLRSAPSINSKVIRQLLNNEFVFYLERSKDESKVGTDKDYWYKIKTTDNKQGWVFGKYFYYLDENVVPEKYYKYIIEDYIFGTQLPPDNGDPTNYCSIFYDLSFENVNDKGYVVFRYHEIDTSSRVLYGSTLFFKIENDIPRMVISGALNDDKDYYFIDKYIFTTGKLGVSVFDTTKDKKGPYAFRNDRVYVVSDSLHMRKWLKKDLVYNDSYVDFDEKNLIATMYLRDEKDQPMRVEKFKFINGKFEHLK